MGRPVVMWVTGISTLVLLDVWASRNDVEGDTLSEVVRDTFRADTPAGRFVFIAAWSGLSAWFVPHICREIEKSLPPESTD